MKTKESQKISKREIKKRTSLVASNKKQSANLLSTKRKIKTEPLASVKEFIKSPEAQKKQQTVSEVPTSRAIIPVVHFVLLNSFKRVLRAYYKQFLERSLPKVLYVDTSGHIIESPPPAKKRKIEASSPKKEPAAKPISFKLNKLYTFKKDGSGITVKTGIGNLKPEIADPADEYLL